MLSPGAMSYYQANLKKVVKTPNPSLKILLVEDDPVYAELIEDLLTSVGETEFQLTSVDRLSEGINWVEKVGCDLMLLDLSLPDSEGLDTIVKAKEQAPSVPIVVLTALNDRKVAIEAVRKGAQDYLIKGRFQRELLIHSIRYAIERDRAEKIIRQQAERERLLARTIERIRSSIDLQNILETTVAEVRRFLSTDLVFIHQCQPNKTEVIVAINTDKLENTISQLDIYNTISKLCCESDRAHLVEAITDIDAAKIDPAYKQILTDFQVKSVLKVPILQAEEWLSQSNLASIRQPKKIEEKEKNTERMWGLLIAYHCIEARQWQPWEIDFLQQLANQVAIAIQQSELYRQLEIANQKLQLLANTDGLTGIANRRQFDRVLEEDWQRLTNERANLSLILCDIDFFKIYNDYYGHLNGDVCIQKIANAIATSVKNPEYLVARYGGEEFGVILPYTQLSQAIAIAREIRSSVASLQLPHAKSSISPYTTLSYGVASTIPFHDRSYLTLVNLADAALYQAKSEGRDRICQNLGDGEELR